MGGFCKGLSLKKTRRAAVSCGRRVFCTCGFQAVRAGRDPLSEVEAGRQADFARVAQRNHRVLGGRADGGRVIQAVGQVFAVEPQVEFAAADGGVVGDKGIGNGGGGDFPQALAAFDIAADIPGAVVFGSGTSTPATAERLAEVVGQVQAELVETFAKYLSSPFR